MALHSISAAVLIGAAALTLSSGADAGSLGKGEVTKLFPGQFEAQVKGYRVSFAGTRGGTLSGRAYGQQDKGRWYMQGTALCVVWTKWTKGKAHCGEIQRQGGWYVAMNGNGEVLKFRRTDLAQN
ncbi:hypothetical protein [Aestuariivirga sp.]|jgi:hypothetical protein|uniref:hypothetical protein n=1 Tax=Aestuariivirga sp. TaxID=2650926 RepID=UPI0037837A27